LTTITYDSIRGTSVSPLAAVPLELTGQLDPKKSWEVSFVLDGVEKKMNVPEDMSLLEAAEKLYEDAPSSCRNGVCTTCSALVSFIINYTTVYIHCMYNIYIHEISVYLTV
jgi:2Fe-2S iron-sulfur cluster binding domain